MLPLTLLAPLIEQSSDCYVLNECLCRHAEHCQSYPVENGCLFLGSGAAQIHPLMGRKLDREAALAHVKRAVAAGLVPLIVQTAFDAYVLGIPYRQMLVLCFCGDSCCTVRLGLRFGLPAFWGMVQHLPGLSVSVDESCVRCGECIELCPVQAIELHDGQAIIGERCKGCSRCASAYPVNAIQMDVAKVSGCPNVSRFRSKNAPTSGSPTPLAI
ncbi:MAG: 4Fe-4S binding protein [Chloroflexi bacterium]|nr:4Fe-4S binding protein [Chloroflexota bacterium]